MAAQQQSFSENSDLESLTFDLEPDHLTKEKVLPQGIDMKHESYITYHSKVMVNVKVFCRQRQTEYWITQPGKNYAPNLSLQGHKKDLSKKIYNQ